MPSKETCLVEERMGLFRDFDTQMFTVVDLCARYNISRRTFYVNRRAILTPIWGESAVSGVLLFLQLVQGSLGSTALNTVHIICIGAALLSALFLNVRGPADAWAGDP